MSADITDRETSVDSTEGEALYNKTRMFLNLGYFYLEDRRKFEFTPKDFVTSV